MKPLLLTMLLAAGCEKGDPKLNNGHIYDTSFGSVYCASASFVEPCGAHLARCHDGHEYFCLINVRERE
jgi:hypothetical protein